MKNRFIKLHLAAGFASLCFACVSTTPKAVQETQIEPEVEVLYDSATPGKSIHAGNKLIELHKGSLAVGQKFPSVLFSATNGAKTDLSGPGEVRLISVVPSIKTKVCDIQSHKLDESLSVHPRVKRMTISLDTSAEQASFAEKAKLTHVSFFSDTLTGDFGRTSGLLMSEKKLLARAVIVVDSKGIIQHLQLVPDVTKLPDLDGAIAMANGLVVTPKSTK